MSNTKTIEDICNILPRSKRNTKYGNIEGKYPFYKGSMNIDTYVDTPDYEGESIIIGDHEAPNIYYAYEFSTSDNCFILQNKNKSISNLKYVYYYLYYNLDTLTHLYTGESNTVKHISKANIKGIKIPIPSIEKQKEIVEYCEKNDIEIKLLQIEFENKKLSIQQYMQDCK
jgi:restriction endonuclease S subunit